LALASCSAAAVQWPAIAGLLLTLTSWTICRAIQWLYKGSKMDALAKAVVDAFAFLELSDDETIDPDAASEAMEMLAYDLQKCTDAEKAALKKALDAEYKAKKARKASKKVLTFYKDFFSNTGLDDEE
jgi:hypothetical protein